MKTTTAKSGKSQKVELTPAVKTKSINPLEGLSFDDVYEMDEKEKKKILGHSQTKESKRLQIFAKINDLQVKMNKAQGDFNLSLTEPQRDSGAIYVQIKCFMEELEIEKMIYNQLFPENPLP